MAPFPFRPHRINTNIEIKVRLQENNPENIFEDEVIATAINVSKGGACLIFPRIFINGVHLFFSTLRDDTHSLVLHYADNESNSKEEFTISAQSVWMDSIDREDGPGFKVGVRFTNQQNTLYDSLKKSFPW